MGAFAIHIGHNHGIVMPNDLPPGIFIELFQHEIAHTRERHFGEQEPEMAEIIGAISVSELEPALAPTVMERVLEIPEDGEAEGIYTKGHTTAMHLIAKHDGDLEAARNALRADDFTSDAAYEELKQACGCSAPSLAPSYRTFAEPFLDALDKTAPVDGAVAGVPETIRTLMRVRLELVVGQAATAAGDQASRLTLLDTVETYLEGHDEIDQFHRWMVQWGTLVGRQAAEAAAEGDKYALHLQVVKLNAAYPASEADAECLKSFIDAIQLAHGETPDEAKIRELTDAWVERFGTDTLPTPAAEDFQQGDLLKAIFVLFWDRAGLEADICDGKTWYEAANGLVCPGGTCSADPFFESWLPALQGKLDDATAANCP